MPEGNSLAERFESNRGHLRAVSYRLLGSHAEADDAVQECWLRLSRANTANVENLTGWLTTVVSRVCLDMLRARKARREEAMPPDFQMVRDTAVDPERQAANANSVGVALLVVLERLTPPERVAFVLHDLFAVPFEQISEILERSLEAVRQLASRARRQVQGAPVENVAQFKQQQQLVTSFLKALQQGDIQALLAVLAPDFVLRADRHSAFGGKAVEVRGAENWAPQAVQFAPAARDAHLALVDGTVGLILAPQGHLLRVIKLTTTNGKVASMEVVGDPERIGEFELAVLDNVGA